MAWDKNIFVGSSKYFSAISQVFMHTVQNFLKNGCYVHCSVTMLKLLDSPWPLKNSKKVVQQTINMIYVLF